MMLLGLILLLTLWALVWYLLVAFILTKTPTCFPDDDGKYTDNTKFAGIVIGLAIVFGLIASFVLEKMKLINGWLSVIAHGIGWLIAFLVIGFHGYDFCNKEAGDAKLTPTLEKLGLWSLMVWGPPIFILALIVFFQSRKKK